jgi:hypothetical protein
MTSFLSVRLYFIKHTLFLHHEKWNKGYKLEKVYGEGVWRRNGREEWARARETRVSDSPA